MKIKLTLQSKIIVFILVPVVLVFLIIGVFVGIRNKNTAVKNVKLLTEKICEKQGAQAEAILNKYISGTITLANSLSGESITLDENAKVIYNQIIENAYLTGEYSVWVLWQSAYFAPDEANASNWLLIESQAHGSSRQEWSIPNFSTRFLTITQTTSFKISDPYQIDGKWYFNIAAPILHTGQIRGFAGVTLETTIFESLLKSSFELSGSSLTIVNNNSRFIVHSNPLFIGRTFIENYPDEPLFADVNLKIVNGEKFNLTTRVKSDEDYSVFIPLNLAQKAAPWSAVYTVSLNEVMKDSYISIMRSVLVGLIGIVLIIIVIFYIAQYLTKPIRQTTNTLKLLSLGNTRKISQVEIKTNDELEEMFNSLNMVIDGIRKTEEFALNIGKGNLDSEYKFLSEDDHLGEALMTMRESLIKNRELDLKRKEEEEHRNWTTEGIAKFGEILRQDNNDMKKLGYNIMSNLIEYLKVNQGALFVMNNENDDDIYFDLVTAIAYGRDKFIHKEIRIGEGLVGRCIYERKTIYITDVPKDYVKITSGLGTANPNCVLIVPCSLNDEVFGVIELAAFTALNPYEIEFVEKLGESIASTISSVRISEKTTKLLKASQVQSEELAAQEEELRQNLEEMETTQEDLKRQMTENIEIRENLAKETALLDALMENLFDLIYFKDMQGRFIRVTKSMLAVHKLHSFDEIIGKSDFDFAIREEAQKYYDDEQKIIKTGIPIINQIQKETRIDGTIQYTTTSKYPLYDTNGKIIGTFGFTKDITDTKSMEISAQEQAKELRVQKEELEKHMTANIEVQKKLSKEKALLDSLLNTLNDLIYFKDKDSKFIRLTKSMLKIFDAKTPDEIIGKSDFDYQPKAEAQKYYDDEQKIIKSGIPIIDQIQRETRYDGRIEYTTTSKYPLVDESGEVIGTFGLTKDITDIKNLESKAKQIEVEMNSMLESIQRTAYTIEYDSDGIITDVSDNLLTLTGLKRKDVIGQHHKDGNDLSSKSEKEYKKMWSEILKGEIVKETNQITINKKSYWLIETYNPIKNIEGKVNKILKIAFDVTDLMGKTQS